MEITAPTHGMCTKVTDVFCPSSPHSSDPGPRENRLGGDYVVANSYQFCTEEITQDREGVTNEMSDYILVYPRTIS